MRESQGVVEPWRWKSERTDVIEVRISGILSNEDFMARRWLAIPGMAEPEKPWTPLSETA